MLPNKPGYYWRLGLNHDDELVNQIVKVDALVSTEPTELFYWEMGDLGAIYIQEDNAVTWYGPVFTQDEQMSVIEELQGIEAILTEYKQDWYHYMFDGVRSIINRLEEGQHA